MSARVRTRTGAALVGRPPGHGFPLAVPPTAPIQQDACSSILGIDKPFAIIFPSRHYPTGCLRCCATTERPLADSQLPSTESRSCGRRESHDRRRWDRGWSASHGQSRVPGCSREASDNRQNQAPPNLPPPSTNLNRPTTANAHTIPEALHAMPTDLQAQFTATIQKRQADTDELRKQHTRTLQHYTSTIEEIWSQLQTHRESLQNEQLRTFATDSIREVLKQAQPQPILPLTLPVDTHGGDRDHRYLRRGDPYLTPTTDRPGNALNYAQPPPQHG
ncbi:hypothetical protein HPB48_025526 [Haemaphysalis longicornis]|uniref:Uncharacterized protein n=1 Tax=Haemaphysalis longicornis TaxID=44386 RepID=A0A9J6HA11_HAELO|nr:hypothetical protein HPB48_025526 [Haemaphysalis longicornis]